MIVRIDRNNTDILNQIYCLVIGIYGYIEFREFMKCKNYIYVYVDNKEFSKSESIEGLLIFGRRKYGKFSIKNLFHIDNENGYMHYIESLHVFNHGHSYITMKNIAEDLLKQGINDCNDSHMCIRVKSNAPKYITDALLSCNFYLDSVENGIYTFIRDNK